MAGKFACQGVAIETDVISGAPVFTHLYKVLYLVYVNWLDCHFVIFIKIILDLALSV